MMVKLYIRTLKKGVNKMKSNEALERQISVLRKELDNLVTKEEIDYEKVLDISRKLDDLIVSYIINKKDRYSTVGNYI
ncbi:Sporulation stage 0, Spo0E-like regulatory phosphatase [Thermoanaerobacter ethanolicus JW 200]|nr:Sporulation stage 0, Spo0E-like regulatory phosphatase [Thermoanaerobacter wiegelii Rt8.B1]EGD52577.1 Sporulation stage 0, Spo0E-like regulatory phosphatase [Thermoanaerobacter ethanolicus JW 200]